MPKLIVQDGEVMWDDSGPDAKITYPIDVFRPSEKEARRLMKQLQQLFKE